jgi:hypothetical protein
LFDCVCHGFSSPKLFSSKSLSPAKTEWFPAQLFNCAL